ncbi:MAG: hypothetical protein GY765_37290 [bacterium]|nr:hypothetical protein [bacterium]
MAENNGTNTFPSFIPGDSLVQLTIPSLVGREKLHEQIRLSVDDALSILVAIADGEGNRGMANYLESDNGKNSVKSFYNLVSGNPGGLPALYKQLALDYTAAASDLFIKIVNDLAPFYQRLLDMLPVQQRKIVQYLCRTRHAVTGKMITGECFIAPDTLARQLSTLERTHWVEGVCGGRDAYYELTDPMARICCEVKENNCVSIRRYVDFLVGIHSLDHLPLAESQEADNPAYSGCYNDDEPRAMRLLRERYPRHHDAFETFGLLPLRVRSSDGPGYGIENDCPNVKLADLMIRTFETNLTPLLMFSPRRRVIDYLETIVVLIRENGYTDYFFKALARAVFNILKRHHDVDTRRFRFIIATIAEVFQEYNEALLPLRFLDIGVRHFKEKEKNVLFRFTREERNLFNTFVRNR